MGLSVSQQLEVFAWKKTDCLVKLETKKLILLIQIRSGRSACRFSLFTDCPKDSQLVDTLLVSCTIMSKVNLISCLCLRVGPPLPLLP